MATLGSLESGVQALSGIVSGNSGDIATLQAQMLTTQQDLLQRPDLTAYNNLQALYNQELDNFGTRIDTFDGTLKTLMSLYTSMAITVSNNFATFTGHTGIATGAGAHPA